MSVFEELSNRGLYRSSLLPGSVVSFCHMKHVGYIAKNINLLDGIMLNRIG